MNFTRTFTLTSLTPYEFLLKILRSYYTHLQNTKLTNVISHGPESAERIVHIGRGLLEIHFHVKITLKDRAMFKNLFMCFSEYSLFKLVK